MSCRVFNIDHAVLCAGELEGTAKLLEGGAENLPPHLRDGPMEGHSLTFEERFSNVDHYCYDVRRTIIAGIWVAFVQECQQSSCGQEWAGVDSLSAMVCGSSPPPAPGSLTCEEKCQAAGHCASGLVSCGQQPSCAQGCAVAG